MSGDAGKKALQADVVATKTRWASQVKVIKAAAGSPNFPLPLAVQRTIPRPDNAEAYDVDELVVKLVVEKIDAGEGEGPPVCVELVSTAFPPILIKHIEGNIHAKWVEGLEKSGSAGSWLLLQVFAWVEEAFVELLRLEPQYLEPYEGCDENGITTRRFAIAEPPEVVSEESEESDYDSDGAASDTSMTSVEKEAYRLERIKLAAQEEEDRLFREERRREAEMYGDTNHRPQQPKKDKDKKQGVRTAKTGSRRTKFDAEAAGKKANKKNGLIS